MAISTQYDKAYDKARDIHGFPAWGVKNTYSSVIQWDFSNILV